MDDSVYEKLLNISISDFLEEIEDLFKNILYLKGLKSYFNESGLKSFRIRPNEKLNLDSFDALCVKMHNGFSIEFTKNSKSGPVALKFICEYDNSYDSRRDDVKIFQYTGNREDIIDILKRIDAGSNRFEDFFIISDTVH